MAFSDYTRPQLIRRSVLMTLGIAVMGFGIAMSKLALLGTTPISTIPAVMSFATDLTIGTWTIIVNLIIIGLEALVLGREKSDVALLLQLAVAIILGVFTDIGVELLKNIVDSGDYMVQWFWCILSCVILSLGIAIEISANVLVAPGDGIVMAIDYRVDSLSFPHVKFIFDCTNVAIAAILSLTLTDGLNGVREGTIFAAVVLGMMVGAWKRLVGPAIDKLAQ